MKKILLLVLIGICFFVSCAPSETKIRLAIAATQSARPPNTPTQLPTATSTPTDTLIPTATLTPTETLIPTLGGGSTQVRPADGMEMVYVPEGTFIMGDNEDFYGHRTVHDVYLDTYWIDCTEVTNAMYALCVAAGTCQPPATLSSETRNSYYDNADYSDYPVIYVDWKDAKTYCEWAGGRLPSEAEWEKAARGTDGRWYPWGDDNPTCARANLAYWSSPSHKNFIRCVGDTEEVGILSSFSPYGAKDMSGNVWEWVADWYGEDYYASSPGNNPTGPSSGEYRVVRGASWLYFNDESMLSSYRGYVNPGEAWNDLGFRCVFVSP